jgi:alpha-glucosidase
MKKVLVFIFLLFSDKAFCEFEFLGNIISHKESEEYIEFRLSNGKFNIYVIDDNIIRLRFTNKDEFSEAPSYSVIFNEKGNVKGMYSFQESDDSFLLSTKELTCEIKKSPCRISFYDNKMNLINRDEESFGVSFDNDEVRCFKTLFDGEQFLGLGEKTGSLFKRGNQYTMWNTDFPAYTDRTDPLYVSIPFFIGIRDKKAYGIFFDNSYKSYFNLGAGSSRFYWFGADKGEMDYYFIYGPEIKKIISSYTMLTGKMKMPPMWALGYQQSKWSYFPETEVATLAKTFRDKEIPCDVIYLDIHYMDGYRVFTWDDSRFPDPEKMTGSLKEKGFKIIPIIDPGVKADSFYFAAKEGLEKDLFAKYPDGEIYQGEVWPSWAYFPDFTNKETRDWWGEKISSLLNQGIEGFWNDMNEPAVWGQAFPDIVQFDDNGYKSDHKKIHNVFALQMAKATFDGIKKYSTKRHFILTRAGFAGIQRYSAVWTGDNVANDEHLRMACVMPQGMGLSGLPFIGSDVGGFMGNPSPRLFTRWMQLGAFTPFFRGHSATNEKAKEPWAFGIEQEGFIRDIISLRYRLLPYLYNEFYNSSKTGLPVLQPMIVNFQDDDECYKHEIQFQFMAGANLLVAPVLNENDNFKKLYLPKGKWMDWWTGEIYEGNKWIVVEAPISKIPLFLREGGIIPMIEKQNYVGEKNISQLELLIYPSDNSFYQFYEDDGITYDYLKGIYSVTQVKAFSGGKSVSIRKVTDKFSTGRKNYLLKIYCEEDINEVKSDNISIKKFQNEEQLLHSNEGFYKEGKFVYIKVQDKPDIRISYR